MKNPGVPVDNSRKEQPIVNHGSWTLLEVETCRGDQEEEKEANRGRGGEGARGERGKNMTSKNTDVSMLCQKIEPGNECSSPKVCVYVYHWCFIQKPRLEVPLRNSYSV